VRIGPRAIDGIDLRDTLEEARALLDQIGKSTGRTLPNPENKPQASKEAWRLDSTEFGSVALKAEADGRIVWISGFVRPTQAIPFGRFGDLAQAKPRSDTLAIWDRMEPKLPYRLIARGAKQAATVVSLIPIGPPKAESTSAKN